MINNSQATAPKKRKPWFSDEPIEPLIGLLIGLITAIMAIVIYLDTDAFDRYGVAMREAQRFTVQSMGERARGEILAGYAWTDAYRMWLELDTQAVLSTAQSDPVASERYRSVRDHIATLTPLLQPPYFDPAIQPRPNLRAYESDLYIEETTASTEHFINAYRIADGWGEKSGAYAVHLILLTVSLFLLGLSTTISERMTWLFITIGSALSIVTLVWMVNVVRTPVYAFPQEAITAFAHGVGLSHQQRYDEAAESFTTAIDLAPEYANALYQRANAYNNLDKLTEAAADYQTAIDAGRWESNVFWNLGWTYYRLGDYTQSAEKTQVALGESPEQIALYYNLGLAQLAAGDFETATTTYEAGSEMVRQVVNGAREQGLQPPTSIWWYLDTAALDLDNLYACATEEKCGGAPPATAIPQREKTAELARNWQHKLQTLSVSLEYSDQISQTATTAPASIQLGELSFTRGVYDLDGKLVSFTTLGQVGGPLRFGMVQENQGEALDTSISRSDTSLNRDIFVNFPYEGIQQGQLLVMKVLLDDREASGLRLVTKWSLAEDGDAVLPLTPGRTFTLSPGNYQIEIYVDGQLIQTGSFEIET